MSQDVENGITAGTLGLCGPIGTYPACPPNCCEASDPPRVDEQRSLADVAFEGAVQKLSLALAEGKSLMVFGGDVDPARIQMAQKILDNAPESILLEAERIVNGQRRGTYGTPENNFQRIADLWNAYLNGKPEGAMPITGQDTALLMILLKVARLIESPRHRDSVVDVAGYAACIETLWANQDETAARLADEL